MVWGNRNVVIRRHIQKLMQVYFPRRTTFPTQTIMIHTFAKKPTYGANQTPDKRSQPGLKHRNRWFKINLTWLKNLLFIN